MESSVNENWKVITCCCQIRPQQRSERIVLGYPRVPSVGRRDCGIECRVSIGEPLRSGIVEVRSARALRSRSEQDPFRRVEPAVAKFGERRGFAARGSSA